MHESFRSEQFKASINVREQWEKTAANELCDRKIDVVRGLRI